MMYTQLQKMIRDFTWFWKTADDSDDVSVTEEDIQDFVAIEENYENVS